MGRVSYTLLLDELPLSDCNDFWNDTGSHFSSYDKFKLLSVIGGIPRYLEEIQTQYSAEENIRNFCFKQGGLLVNEFEQIFSDLFGKRGEKYKNIVRLLVQKSLEYGEICEKLYFPLGIFRRRPRTGHGFSNEPAFFNGADQSL